MCFFKNIISEIKMYLSLIKDYEHNSFVSSLTLNNCKYLKVKLQNEKDDDYDNRYYLWCTFANFKTIQVLQDLSRQLTSYVFLVDGGDEGDLPLPLHHVAWFWCPRISGLLPPFPLQRPRVWLVRRRAWTVCGALQRRDRTLGDFGPGGHLLGPGEGLFLKDEEAIASMFFLLRHSSPSMTVA